MGLRKAKILIVDDDEKHGLDLTKTIWKSGWPVLFVHYSADNMINSIYGEHSGVRVIFMDIDLLGAGLSGDHSALFSPALAVLKKILHDNNGPYTLVTWTTYVGIANEFYGYLIERLPEKIKPVCFEQIDKERAMDPSSGEEYLKDLVVGILTRHSALGCLVEWEGHVQSATSEVLGGLTKAAGDEKESFNVKLQCLLQTLAEAEAGKWLKAGDDIAKPLYSFLSSLLSDRLSYAEPKPHTLDGGECNGIGGEKLEKWVGEVNTFLHLDLSKSSVSSPGALFSYPLNKTDSPLPVMKTENDIKTCIRGNFLNFHDKLPKFAERKVISGECKLYLMDIVPPCDHSQKKLVLRRFLVVCKIPWKHVECLWVVEIDKKDNHNVERVNNKMKDNLWISPRFSNESEDFVLVANANLQGSILEPKNNDWSVILGETEMRIREHLLQDIVGWMGRHITRRGVVSLR